MLRRVSFVVLLAALATVSLLGGIVPGASAARSGTQGVDRSSALTRGSAYLALGDSVPFGFQESTVIPTPNYFDPASFPGYPEQLGRELHVRVTNLACPGETSASLIDASAPSNGCEGAYRKAYPLHVRYRGSQLTSAVSFLRRHPGVRLVSLMIGANDLFLCQAKAPQHCTTSAEQRPVLNEISRNVRRILSTLRNRAGYHGQVAFVNYYSLNYASPPVNAQSKLLNRALDSGAKGFQVVFANGYGAFQAASVKFANQPCLAGLITQLGGRVGDCGVHPSYAGQALLAQALLTAIRH